MKRAILEKLQAARAAKRPVVLATDVKTGDQILLDGGNASGDLSLAPDAMATVKNALADDKSGMVDTSAGPLFVQVFNPPLRMVVVGAVHIAQALAPMASLTGYEVVIVDPRRAFATDARFPNTKVTTEWPDDALARLQPDRRTAIVTLTHDPKIDDPALQAALQSEAFYIAALGSKKTHAARLGRLKKAGFDDAATARIHGPAGLSIGAQSPAEIALSIMGQATQALHGRDAA